MLLELKGVSCSANRFIWLGHDCRGTRSVQTYSGGCQCRSRLECQMCYRGLKDTNMPKSLQCMIQTCDFDRSFPQGQWRSQTALVPKITTRGAISVTTWQWLYLYCYRVYYQMARVNEHLVSKFHEDCYFHWLTGNPWFFHWGYEEGINSHFPLCDFLGLTSSGVFNTKTAISSFITFSVDS